MLHQWFNHRPGTRELTGAGACVCSCAPDMHAVVVQVAHMLLQCSFHHALAAPSQPDVRSEHKSTFPQLTRLHLPALHRLATSSELLSQIEGRITYAQQAAEAAEKQKSDLEAKAEEMRRNLKVGVSGLVRL